MIKDRWDERLAFLAVDVVRKDECNDNDRSSASRARCVSGVTNGSATEGNAAQCNDAEGFGDTCSTPPEPDQEPLAVVDWSLLTIDDNPDDDGTAAQIVDENKLYEAMGFNVPEETNAGAAREEVPIPAMSAEM